MLDRGHHLSLRSAIARQLVRDHHTRHAGLALQQLPEQAFGGPLVPPLLDENVEHDPILVDRAPEPMLRSPDHQAHFVEVPLVSRVWQLAADLVGERLAELARPLAHGFMAHVDAAGGQHLFHHAQAQRKAEVQPHGVADNLARKAVAGVGGLGGGCLAGPLPAPPSPAKPRPKLTVPRNALARVQPKQRPAVVALLKTIFAQDTAEAAREQWASVADTLRERFPKLADLMDGSREDVLVYMAFPREHWAQIASTNPLERLNREIKRRADVVGIFPNDPAVIRLVGALMLEQNDEWAVSRRYMSLESLSVLSDDPVRRLSAVAA